MRHRNSQYLDGLAASTPLDRMLNVLKQDAIDRFMAGRKDEAGAKFKEGVMDAIKIANRDRLLDPTLKSMFLGIQLRELDDFERSIDRIINYIMSK